MVDYGKALEEGFAAARRADAARQEIEEVFTDLRTQVLTATANRIQIERLQYEVEDTGWAALLYTFPQKPKDKYWAIAAFNPSVGRNKAVQLARWVQDNAGYPCKVTWSQQEHICEDREALSICLAELLSDPVVGQKLNSLTKLKPQKTN